MKREIMKYRRGDCGCCPGHDRYPCEAYGNRRSKRARARDIKLEHQHARSIQKRELQSDLLELGNK